MTEPPVPGDFQAGDGLPQQPTVLDWFKSLLRLNPIPFPQAQVEDKAGAELAPVRTTARTEPSRRPDGERWRFSTAKLIVPGAFLMAFAAQFALERRAGGPFFGVTLYLGAAGLLLWALRSSELRAAFPPAQEEGEISLAVRPRLFFAALALGAITFFASSGNLFRPITLVAWVGATVLLFAALWDGDLRFDGVWARVRNWWQKPKLSLQLEAWHFLLIGAVVLVSVFRYAQLDTVPYEMWSDHAEKLLDVQDVLNGDTHIFFPRNSGREAIEFYLAAGLIKYLGASPDFLTLKVVTASAGLVATLFLYFFAKEIGGRRVGLFALLLAGMAFWPNITSRAGVRSPLNELAVAPALFFTLRAMRRGRRNDFLWAGLAVGLGLQGYSGARVLPVAVLLAFVLYVLQQRSASGRMRTLAGLTALVLVAVVGFSPLFRVLVETPDQVLYRVLTRVSPLERPLEGSPVVIFLRNLWNVLTMFSWDSGEIWVMTVPGRPALDWITGAVFHLGIFLTAYLAWRRRRWQYLYLLLLVPVLLLPSALALAFPNENPAPARVSGAIVPVFTIAALGMDSLLEWLRDQTQHRSRALSTLVILVLLLGVGLSNYRLVIKDYADRQRASAWNATEAGVVMKGFAESVGSFDEVYLVHTPFWMDSRLIAIEAGAPIRDYSVQQADLPGLELTPDRYHLFFLKPEDSESLQALREHHPGGQESYFHSDVDGRDFILYLLPATIQPELRPVGGGGS